MRKIRNAQSPQRRRTHRTTLHQSTRRNGWETLNCYSKFDQKDRSSLGRQTKSEVVLIPRLQAALSRLNPNATPEAIAKAIEELTRSRALMSGVEANREIYVLLKDDVPD